MHSQNTYKSKVTVQHDNIVVIIIIIIIGITIIIILQ